MSDENNELEQQEIDDTQAQIIQEPEIEAHSEEAPQSKAKATGHMSKEEWIASGRDEKDYKSEKEFELTGELIELKKIIRNQQTDIKEIIKYHDDVVAAQKLNFRQQLDAQIKYAKETGDVEQVEQLVEERRELNEREKQQALSKQDQTIKNSIESFIERNKHWYNEQNMDLVEKAQKLEVEIRSGEYTQKTGVPIPTSYEGVLRQVELEIKAIKAQSSIPQESYRPVMSGTQSSVNKETKAVSKNDDVLYGKLNPSEKSMFHALKRINQQVGREYSVKQFLDKIKNDKEV